MAASGPPTFAILRSIPIKKHRVDIDVIPGFEEWAQALRHVAEVLHLSAVGTRPLLRHDEEQVARMVADVALPKVKEVHVNVGVFSTDPFWRTENLIAMEC